MSPQRRTALVSVPPPPALVALKLVTGLASGSLGLVSEALHSAPTSSPRSSPSSRSACGAARPTSRTSTGTGRPSTSPRSPRPPILASSSLAIAGLAVARLTGGGEAEVERRGGRSRSSLVVIAIDAGPDGRLAPHGAPVRQRGAAVERAPLRQRPRRLARGPRRAPARARRLPDADSLAALFVAGLVLLAAGRLIRRNVDVLMDRAPAMRTRRPPGDRRAGSPDVDLRRLRLRQAAGAHFADVVIGFAGRRRRRRATPLADAVEDAVQRALPESDVVVHVEPRRRRPRCASGRTPPRSRCRASARSTTSTSSRRRGGRALAPPEAAR